jgi:PAS domain S-box-containing protein
MDDLDKLRQQIAELEQSLKKERDNRKGIESSQKLIEVLSGVQSQFILDAKPRELFDRLLSELLSLTNSEYGFIGEVLWSDSGDPFLKTYAITNISWNEKWMQFYRENGPQGMIFTNLKTLFGVVLTSGQPVISNDPANDPRKGGLPEGHPTLNAFLGLPIYQGDKFVGMIGIANRPNGYDDKLIAYLKPFIATCASMIESVRSDHLRRIAEEALAGSEARMQAIVNTAVDSIITIDERGIVQAFNPAAEKIFGYNADEVIGHNVSMLIPSPHQEKHDSYIARYLQTGESRIMGIGREVDALRKDGTTFPAELSLSELRTESDRLFTGILRDITKRKETETKLDELYKHKEKAHDYLLSLMNMLKLGVVALDEKSCITFINETAQNLTGKSQSELLKKLWTEVFSLGKEDLARIKALLKSPPDRREKIQVQTVCRKGRRYWLEIDVKNDPRNPLRKILALYDMTEVYNLRRLLEGKERFRDLVGKSKVMQDVYQRIREVAQVDWTVLIEGETGTGKELTAKAIHSSSHRRDKPFVTVNCAGLTDSLLTSQLFGHRRGAFTGAVEDHQGVFEAAHEGILFLDEIGDISKNMQTSLLRVLEETQITRLGETKPRKIDVRVLAATHRDLAEEVKKGNFRPDLLYRLRIARITLPTLNERREDIPLLVESFLGQSRYATGKKVANLSDEALRTLLAYAWPGNVRELKSALDYATLHCKGPTINLRDLPPEVRYSEPAQRPAAEEPQDERQRILAALEQAENSRTRAARLLGMSRATFYRRLSKLKIKPSE